MGEEPRDWNGGAREATALLAFARHSRQRGEHDNHPIELSSREFTQQKIDYIHQNPVVAGFVYKAEDYVYSSASNYAELNEIIAVDCLFEIL